MKLLFILLITMSVLLKRSVSVASKSFAGQFAVNRMFSASASDAAEENKAMYTLGVNVARQAAEMKTLLDNDQLSNVAAGFKDALLDQVDGDENELYTKYGPMIQKIMTKHTVASKTAGAEFLQEYLSSNTDAIKTESGLVYHETAAGTGTQPTAENTVKVHYTGKLTTGEVFDSSVQRGEPISFPLNGVIPGWTEGVALMKTGGKATLVIPSEIAYGDKGSPPVIPGGATLVFDIELLEIS